MMWNKNELTEMLRSRRLEVSFIKKDGSLRVMNCTLLEKYLPTNDKETTKKENDSALSVWDIDNNGWRSFRLDSITEVRIVIND